jgi:hypothetical protein
MRVAKKLSANDIGTTGGHQAGILVPKEPSILGFFPGLSSAEKNPRVVLVVREKGTRTRWDFNFIYYNNKYFGGTRNEFRLTGMTRYLRAIAAREGDTLIFTKDGSGAIEVELRRAGRRDSAIEGEGILELGSGWIQIDL